MGPWGVGPCAVCGLSLEDVDALAAHLVGEAQRSDVAHVMWLNRNVTKRRTGASELAGLLGPDGSGQPTGTKRVAR